MALVEDVARSALAALGSDANYLLAAQFVSDRFKQFAGRVRLRSLRQVFSVSVPANISTGTVQATRGSVTLVGDATARASWSKAMIGWWIRPGQSWYEIGDLDPSGNLLLKVPYGDQSCSGSYVAKQRFTPLDPAVRWIGPTMVLQRRQQPITAISMDELDTMDPARMMTNAAGTYPTVFAERGHGTDNATQKTVRYVEIYPPSADTETYNYVGYVVPPDLGLQDPIPPEVDEYVLREGVLADLMRHKMAAALEAQPPRMEEAAHWRNEYRAQETVWERKLNDAFRADSASDDITFVLRRNAYSPARDIVNAKDEVLARWPR